MSYPKYTRYNIPTHHVTVLYHASAASPLRLGVVDHSRLRIGDHGLSGRVYLLPQRA